MSARLRWGFDRKAAARKRPVPLVRAYTGPWPILSHRTMAEVDQEYQAKAGDEVQGGRACEPCMEPVSRPAAGRSAAATSELMDVTAGETALEFPERLDGFASVQDGLCQMSTNGALSAGTVTPAARTSATADVTAGETAPVSDPVQQAPVVQASVPAAMPIPLLGPTRSPPVRVSKIAIADVPSGMEAAADKWRAPAEQQAKLPPVPGEDGKVWCDGCDARVPTWFGRDCISATCSLKGLA